MFGLKYLYKTLNYYLRILIMSVAIVLLHVAFVNPTINYSDAQNTFSNFTAEIMSYDKRPEQKDSFAFFDDNYSLKNDLSSGLSLNATIYQFLDEVEYTDKSIINKDNIYKGEFSILSKNQIAVSKSLSDIHKLNIGDVVYLNEDQQCEIKFITNNYYSVSNVNFASNESCVFIGKDTISLKRVVSYANFDIKYGEMHNNIYDFHDIRTRSSLYLSLIYIGSSVLIFGIIFAFDFINRRKIEQETFDRLKHQGLKHIYLNILLNEMFYIIPSICIFALVSLLISNCYLLFGLNLLAFILASMIHSIIVYKGGR